MPKAKVNPDDLPIRYLLRTPLNCSQRESLTLQYKVGETWCDVPVVPERYALPDRRTR